MVDLTDVPQVGAAARDVLRAAQRRCAAREITMEIIGAGSDRSGDGQPGAVPQAVVALGPQPHGRPTVTVSTTIAVRTRERRGAPET